MRKICVGVLALHLTGCGTSPPSITLDALTGDYRAAGCPVVQIRGNTMFIGGQHVRMNVIRIKLENVIVADRQPRVDLDGGCQFSMVEQPIYMPVRRKDHRIFIEMETIDGASVVSFEKVSGASPRDS